MKDVMISSNDVKNALTRVKDKMMQKPEISDMTKALILDALFKALYEVIWLEESASRKELNKWLDEKLGIKGEDHASD